MDHQQKLGLGQVYVKLLSIYLSKSKQEELDIYYTSKLSSEILYFGIERFCSSIGAPVVKEV